MCIEIFHGTFPCFGCLSLLPNHFLLGKYMPFAKYPELRCAGHNKNNCENNVVHKTMRLCQSCYMRKRYKEMSSNKKAQEKERKKEWNKWAKEFGVGTKQKPTLDILQKESNIKYYSLKFNIKKKQLPYTKEEFYIWYKDQPKQCTYCKEKAEHLDHIVPVAKQGTNEFSNLQLLCGRCNRAKWDSSEEEFLSWLKKLRLVMEPLS